MDNSKKSMKIIVCGTNFGRMYLEGVNMLRESGKLVGVLSGGSSQSRACANENDVPLYTSVDELNKSIVDIVCVAVKSSVTGGNGTDIAIKCLEKGISVFQEQPVHYDDVWKCYKTAIKNDCHYAVNGFYSNVNAGKTFIEYGRKLLKKSKALFIDASSSVQVSYPLVDLLGKLLGSVSPYEIRKISEKNDVMTVLEGKVCNIPLIIKGENRMVAEDSDNYALLFHKIILYTESGQLILDNSIGIVLWEPRYYIPHTEDGRLDFYGDNQYSKIPVTEILNKQDLNNSYKDIYEKIWPGGIANALKDFISTMDAPLNKKGMQYNLNICKFWNQIGNALGTIQIIKKPEIVFLKAEDVKKGI
ncbi:oxidoreductase family, NAD-binding Rossmann fold [Clostridium puniceum]|uniref:Oxidoreductase family, NAD-binding Rossmann fold n=1 Tax=Clostridium puniceum TaxID=29367 RepID=A0A1S8T1U6_9CLOT|nr:Gfo/Idh/MocA family oxidoreductase [Clostridium puniceum]OOM71663.1 oxidoreductase family, NAD-binding Rossmann fold [Clostridium puniceum]